MSFGLSFTSFDMLQAPKFIGLDNYINLFLNDEVFLIALKNTFILAVITGPVSYIMAFVFAWLINELPRKIRWLMTLIFYAPSISGSAYLLWQLIFSSDMYGVLNATLMDLGIINAPILWLDTPQYALPILIIVQLWLSLGVSFLAFIAGLQTVDKTLYEAGGDRRDPQPLAGTLVYYPPADETAVDVRGGYADHERARDRRGLD